ncbi:sarcosine oxidase subunit delta [Rhodalgimonas zhirmunskyi]|uniref:Sarcosine oxidase subunit delta n=1 Tax=Rhodalgimonas zhirmunskyi TaxID=2964767 RepID=A0AAJ1U4Y8_9RHOB|nr:sarcosine oxidase subunit delta [Rhodoalgimonas zhirmunskyi]MDQ2093260.1 sarcosine oxidase subunit delta [Rhodoalgimonas zhirmunskyi]
MRLTCPLCGARDRREFTYQGEAVALSRPDPDAGPEAWNTYLHLRENPAGWRDELWYHEQGCAAWLVVTRHTTTHEVRKVQLARDVAKAEGTA